MKKLVLFIIIGLVFSSCGEEGSDARSNIDSTLKKVENKAVVLADSAKEKYKTVRDHLNTAFDRNRKDTTP